MAGEDMPQQHAPATPPCSSPNNPQQITPYTRDREKEVGEDYRLVGDPTAPGRHSSPGLKAWGFLASLINSNNIIPIPESLDGRDDPEGL